MMSHCTGSLTGVSLRADQCCADLMLMARQARTHRLGPLHPSFDLLQLVRNSLLGRLPDDAHSRVSGRLGVSLTRVSNGRNVLVSEFLSREELVEVRSPRPASGGALSVSTTPYQSGRVYNQRWQEVRGFGTVWMMDL